MRDRLLDVYDAILLDLDGTVYRGAEAVSGAADTVTVVRKAGTAVRFVTNNAARSPTEVADQLVGLGIPTEPAEICTSAQAAADVLADRLPPGATVLVVGTNALADEVREVGLRPVAAANQRVDAVVQGLSREIGWRELSEACLAVRGGAFWVACNADPTLPTERGQVIGNGALVAAVSVATGRKPVVAGKPNRPLMDRASRSAGARRPLVVGDRLDTDIDGAAAAGQDALLVLSGVTRPADLLGSSSRPRYLAADLTALTERPENLEVGDQPGWAVATREHTLYVRWTGAGHADPIGLLRALCAREVSTVVAEDDTASAALSELGLRDRLA
jgi:HAD superfamily hydrolase (TIGR01450 family)